MGNSGAEHINEVVLIFGQGPVITEPEIGINNWSKSLARAAFNLKRLDKDIKEFIVLGGRTGGDQHPSEAHLIADEIVRLGVPRNLIITEEDSKDTIENIVNFINHFGNITEKTLSILTAPQHALRVQILLRLFCVPYVNEYTSTEVNRSAAKIPVGERLLIPDIDKWDIDELRQIESMTSLNDPDWYKDKFGVDNDYRKRLIKERVLIRELLELPEKWLPAVGKINDNKWSLRVLIQIRKLYPFLLRYRYGIALKDITDETVPIIKQRLREIPTYQGLSDNKISDWMINITSKGFPKQTQRKIDLLEARFEDELIKAH